MRAAGVGGWNVGIRRDPSGKRAHSYTWDNPQGGFYTEHAAVPGCVGHLPATLKL